MVKHGRTNFRCPPQSGCWSFICEVYSLEVLWRCEKKLTKTQTNILKPQTRSSSLLAREAERNKSMAGHKKDRRIQGPQKQLFTISTLQNSCYEEAIRYKNRWWPSSRYLRAWNDAELPGKKIGAISATNATKKKVRWCACTNDKNFEKWFKVLNRNLNDVVLDYQAWLHPRDLPAFSTSSTSAAFAFQAPTPPPL